jgi:hypothetical protein
MDKIKKGAETLTH